MEKYPLNKAHQLQRRIEFLLRQKKFNECIEIHKIASDFINKALILTENLRSIESLTLQRDYHLKQVETIKIKQLQYEQQKNKQIIMMNQSDEKDFMNEENIETMIFRTMDTHDSLIEILMQRGKNQNTDENIDVCDGIQNVKIKKFDVDDSTIIEEFKVLSNNLREAVKSLLDILDEKNKEIERLKELYRLEIEKNKDQKNNTNCLKITDSSNGTSASTELSPDVLELRPLPSLAPLGLPSFDFSSITKTLEN